MSVSRQLLQQCAGLPLSVPTQGKEEKRNKELCGKSQSDGPSLPNTPQIRHEKTSRCVTFNVPGHAHVYPPPAPCARRWTFVRRRQLSVIHRGFARAPRRRPTGWPRPGKHATLWSIRSGSACKTNDLYTAVVCPYCTFQIPESATQIHFGMFPLSLGVKRGFATLIEIKIPITSKIGVFQPRRSIMSHISTAGQMDRGHLCAVRSFLHNLESNSLGTTATTKDINVYNFFVFIC